MESKIGITLACPTCGSQELEKLDVADGVEPDSARVRCKSCGALLGTWGEVKAQAKRVALDRVRLKFRNTFKGLKGWKLK
ncbi:ECs_2282 family putative zinc-binding protein [Methylobrevis pamukkalensis]|uniref:Uncharacterized protein n=1 Tax=Methylobrevis pamukkalensis TaxID=1439726 RepID=A0A1E3H0W2_9HYPH|nr:hypothetical protein [Methylobrevis pamukkalensis]ODN69211.1 hypothetical protein A6302_03473 [Methylobrevis pamukkalensis]